MTADQIRGLREGKLPLAEVVAVSAHARACAACAALVADTARITDGVAELRRELAAAPARSPRRRLWLAAAAALLVALAVVFFRPSRISDPAPPRAQQMPPTETATAPAPPSVPPAAAPRYARVEWERAVDAALASGRIAVSPAVAALQRPRTSLRTDTAAPASSRALAPAGEVVATDRPTFTWSPRAGETATVLLFAGDEQVETSAPLRVNRWTPSSPLRADTTYTWQLEIAGADGETLLVPTPPDPPALFRVMSAEARAELAEAKRVHPDDHLLLAVLHARHGALSEARSHLRAYTTHGPTRLELEE